MSDNLWQDIWHAIRTGPRCGVCNAILLTSEVVAGRCSQCEERLSEVCPCCNGKGRLEIILGSIDDR